MESVALIPAGMTALLHQTFAGKRVLLTGHTGFKGSWLLVLLRALGAEVYGYALPPEGPLYNQLGGDTLCRSTLADVRDAERLAQVLAACQPHFVLHLAAQALVRRSYRQPAETFAVNTTGTLNVLEALRRYAAPCVCVVVTTDKVYENREVPGYAYREDDPLGGHDPYSASKAAAEIVVSSYRRSFFSNETFAQHGKSIATARAGNVIGGGDWAEDRILPDMVRALQSNTPLAVRNPGAVRPWQHVLEPLCGYLLLAARMAQQPAALNEAFNFGPHTADVLPVKQLVAQALAAWGAPNHAVEAGGDAAYVNAPHEAQLLQLDIAKAAQRLQWQPKLTAAQAIALTMDWYKHAGTDALAYTRQQVDFYLNRFD
jgi:CDP-glucose 4,6-dehydratase